MKIAKIVSGGQTGVDQGALQACQWIDFPYGGWVPKGRLTEAGPLPGTFKGMQEHGSADYLKRTEANVVDSDATLLLCHGKPGGRDAPDSAVCRQAQATMVPCPDGQADGLRGARVHRVAEGGLPR